MKRTGLIAWLFLASMLLGVACNQPGIADPTPQLTPPSHNNETNNETNVESPAATPLALTDSAGLGQSPNSLPEASSDSPPSGPYLIIEKTDYIVDGLRISNPNGHCIIIKNSSNVLIQNSTIGPCGGHGIDIQDSVDISIQANDFADVWKGVYAHRSSQVDVSNNHGLNLTSPDPIKIKANFVQFDKVSGSGNRINYNVIRNIPGESYPEDIISLFEVEGAVADPIQVIGNRIWGGGPSASGGGIMTGDSGGSNILVKDNILVDPGQFGIAIAGGHNIQVVNNKIFARPQSFNNVGIYVWRATELDETPECREHTVLGNQVNYSRGDGTKNGGWNSENCMPVVGWNENEWDATIDENIWDRSNCAFEKSCSPQQRQHLSSPP